MAAATSSIFDALKPIAGRALEAALNRLLALDPETHAALSALEGRRIQLTMEAPALAVELTVRDGRFVVGPVRTDAADAEAAPDLAVRSRLGGLVAPLTF